MHSSPHALRAEITALPPCITKEFLLHHRMCPMGVDGEGRLRVAVAPEALACGLDDLSFVYRAAIDEHPVSTSELVSLIERAVRAGDRDVHLDREIDPDGDDLAADVRDLANQPPVVRFVNLLIRDAFESGASDVHLEATRKGLTTRFRLDGVLTAASDPPPELQHAVVSRIKLLAELDIAERRRPQDGRIRMRLEDRELDLRVSTVPTTHGESVVLRLLDRGGPAVALEDLGMEPEPLATLVKLVRQPHGLVLVTGPTGSGKTTTLYAALARRDVEAEKIITVEDPVEYQLAGVTQMPVHRQAGVTFPSALRAILRQDPDVVMIGEMRDRETAEIAVQAAMTGHLVVSTLHTNDAVSSVPRLRDLGIPDYLVAATLDGILAQRLVRRVCQECSVPYDPAPELLLAFPESAIRSTTLRCGSGCAACRGTGFKGRIGIFELLVIDDVLRDAISRGATRGEVRELAAEQGMATLRADGWVKCQRSLTTIEELLRVIQD